MKALLIAGIALLAGYASLCLLLYSQQDRLIYPGAYDSNPQNYSFVRLPSGPADLKVWVLHPDAEAALLYFGGNGEDLAFNLPYFDDVFPDRAVYFMNYRGYGGSTGKPSEAALFADAQATYDFIRRKHEKIAVMGRSLGTGVAVALATTRKVERVILVTPYDSIANVAAGHYPWMPVRWLIKDDYDSAKRAPALLAPVLVVIAERDESIPRASSDALLAAIPEALRRSLVFPGRTHNDLGDYRQYLQKMREFLTE